MFDSREFQRFISEAVAEYNDSAPAIARYLEGVYDAIEDGRWESVTLADITAIERLKIDGEWEHPNYAQNRIYKHLEERGDAEGIVSF